MVGIDVREPNYTCVHAYSSRLPASPTVSARDTGRAMSEENVKNARRNYARLNEAYRAGDPSIFRPILEEYFDQDVVFEPAGVLPDSSRRPHEGWDGVLAFIGNQMEAFSEGWLEATEFIDRGDYLIVPYRFGGRARH